MQPRFIVESGGAFGNSLIAALIVAILNDNQIDAVVKIHPHFMKLVDCPKWSETTQGITVNPQYSKHGWLESRRSILLQAFDILARGRDLKITRNAVPVIYYDLPEVPAVDVTLCTGGDPRNWTPYRDWPFFPALKDRLRREGISFIDLTAERIRDVKCLNYVKKSKLYVGLETGTSHYVSSVVNKSLIIQSGFAQIGYWSQYNYDYIALDVPCAPCFLLSGCQHDHRCMRQISVDAVFEKILDKLRAP